MLISLFHKTVKSLSPSLILFVLLFYASCKQPEDQPGPDDPRLQDKRYCNDPEAVNYNWDFPGKPDNSVCFYASDVFKGNYFYVDSAYNIDNELLSSDTFLFKVIPLSRKTLATVGLFCTNDTLFFTADKFATATIDSISGDGQVLKYCPIQDTISGSIAGSLYDSLSSRLNIYATFTRTGSTVYHRGTARKQ